MGATGLPCPACGGAPGKATKPRNPAKRQPPAEADRGKSVTVNLDMRTWERVCEAAKLNGREPGQWARDALMQAAAGQLNKAVQWQRAGSSADG